MRARPVLALAAAWLAAAGCSAFRQTPAWELPPPPPLEAPVVAPERVHRSELPNGLALLILEDPRLPRVELGVTLRRGEAVVPRERAGVASFTADLMERGAGERDGLALARAVDELGASLAVQPGFDSMSVEISGLSRDLDALIALLADVTLRPRFDPAEAVKARSEQLAGLEQAKDDPGTLAGWYLQRTLYPEHRFGLPLAGSPESVRRLGSADARAFHQQVFVPGNAILHAVGDVTAEALAAKLAAAFGAWPAGPVPDAGPPVPATTPAARRIVLVDRPELSQAQVALGHEGIARTDPRRIPVQLMNTVIGGGGFSSRLMVSARSEGGLTYGVYSSFVLGREPGPFSVTTFTRIDEVGTMVDLLLRELARARTEPPSEQELQSARTYAVGRFALGLESSAAVAGALVDLDVYGLPEDSLDTYRSKVRAVTVADTAREAEARLHPDRIAITVVGPAAALAPQLERFGPVEVVTP